MRYVRTITDQLLISFAVFFGECLRPTTISAIMTHGNLSTISAIMTNLRVMIHRGMIHYGYIHHIGSTSVPSDGLQDGLELLTRLDRIRQHTAARVCLIVPLQSALVDMFAPGAINARANHSHLHSKQRPCSSVLFRRSIVNKKINHTPEKKPF